MTEKIKEGNRCQRCAKMHKKCDRRKPSCTRCQEREVSCIYINKTAYQRHDLIPEKSLNCFKLESFKLDFTSEGKEDKKERKWELLRLSNSSNTTKLLKNIGDTNSLLHFVRRHPRMGPLENLFTLMQHPSLTQASNSLDILLKLIEKLGLIATKPTPKQQEISRRPKELSLNFLLDQAIQNFLKYNNKIFPLFIEEDFDFFSKPLVLRLAIMASGVMWMNKEPATEYLFSLFSFHLQQKLRSIFSLKPTLETIQTIIILITGFNMPPWVIIMRPLFQKYCDKMIAALGLHMSNKKNSKKRELERAMTYSSFNIAFQFYLAILGFHNHPPNIRSEFTQLSNYFQTHLNYSLRFKPTSSFIDSISLHSFYSDLSPLVFEMGYLKASFLASKISIKQLNILSLSLLKKVERIQVRFLSYYSHVYSTSSILPDYHNLILFYCHFLRFFIYSISFYHFSNQNPEVQLHSETDPNIINKAIYECKRVIELSSLLPHHFQLNEGLAHTSQCLVFLVRYQKYSKINYHDVIQKGLDYFKSIKYPILFRTAQFNIPFISLVRSYVEQ